jgi:hypothetical protein
MDSRLGCPALMLEQQGSPAACRHFMLLQCRLEKVDFYTCIIGI